MHEPVDDARPGAGGVTLTRRKGVVAAVAAALVLLAGVGVVLGVQQAGRHDLERSLAGQVTALLERATPAEHHEHGHDFGEDAGRVVCAVEPFGFDPPDARAVSQVRWVYARHMCAVTGTGTNWAMSVRASGPIAVRLGGAPWVRVPEPGPGYPDRVREIVPERYHEEAFEEFADEGVIEAARDRFERQQAVR
ncbi:hypothetical protein HTZ77_13675 [Nonomuraea sp. SMC257]|uniref:Uncharacterized protein n=1 Tax=Nonomuraea montanisoli TaxID=2741721 RepID=A0A7Y6I6G5_9ACTN|nr:hypothetical protein [Nonomuraea montanisoli]NUW32471.1 hypothetical protein [Nonomuraea montanisoli]